MMAEHLKIYGDATVGGGTFDKVRIYGDGLITNEVVANSIKVYGDATFEGRVEAKSIKVMGDCDFKDHVICDSVSIYGDTTFEGSLDIKLLKIRGMATMSGESVVESIQSMGACVVNGMLKSERLTSYGSLDGDGSIKVHTLMSQGEIRTRGELEGEYLNIHGAIHNAKLINGEEIHIVLNEHCRCESIGATKLTVSPSKKKRVRKTLTVNQVEGDEVNLTYTLAKRVHGEKVIIGAECRIDYVEYSKDLTTHPTAQIKQQVRN